ncbi:hypothetical protein [Methylocystis parvus]|uniref:hypothetical protein n=1 Tax=Methylocystis parvus TaxID=134 RepID=UPI003C775991
MASAPAHAQENRFALSYGDDGQAPAHTAWRRRVERARLDYDAFAARAVEVYLSYAPPAPREKRAPGVTTIMRDPTLRAGDIYAATDGFMVFRGRAAAAHAPADFTPLPDERARKLSLAIAPAR